MSSTSHTSNPLKCTALKFQVNQYFKLHSRTVWVKICTKHSKYSSLVIQSNSCFKILLKEVGNRHLFSVNRLRHHSSVKLHAWPRWEKGYEPELTSTRGCSLNHAMTLTKPTSPPSLPNRSHQAIPHSGQLKQLILSSFLILINSHHLQCVGVSKAFNLHGDSKFHLA